MKEAPQYWELLSEDDKLQYTTLQKSFGSGALKKMRNGRAETFEEVLEEIKHFCIKEEDGDNDWKRFLVCGICWMDQAIAINTRQLKLLVCKCKSSINGSLQKMGYTTNMAHSESWKILFPKIPLLKDHYSELRKWTIRYKPGCTPESAPRAELSQEAHVQIPKRTVQKHQTQTIKQHPTPAPTRVVAPPIQVQQIQQQVKPRAYLPIIEKIVEQQRIAPPLIRAPAVPLKFRRKMSRLSQTYVSV